MIAIPAYANITVSPTRLEINANKVRSNYATTAVDVRGSNQKAVRYRAYTEYFEIDENAQMKKPDGKNNPHNITSKVRFVPSEFTIPPGKSQKLRVNIANINSLPDGESRAVIYLENVIRTESGKNLNTKILVVCYNLVIFKSIGRIVGCTKCNYV